MSQKVLLSWKVVLSQTECKHFLQTEIWKSAVIRPEQSSIAKIGAIFFSILTVSGRNSQFKHPSMRLALYVILININFANFI